MPLLADNVRSLYASLVVLALVITSLVLGRDILIPLAIATLVAFILNPFVRRLMRWRLPEALAVTIVLAGVITMTIVLSTVFSAQLLSLTADLQSYRYNLIEKVRDISAFGKGDGTLKRATDAVGNLGAAIENEFRPGTGPAALPASPGPSAGSSGAPQVPTTVPTNASKSIAPDASAVGAIAVLGGPLAMTALTLLFTLFLLLQHQDLRDRIVRIAGTDNLSGTTAALSDAGTRLSSLFLAQAILNAAFGVFIGAALALIGVPNPILWGIVTAIMRFVPFIGTFIAAAPPIILAAAVDPGWSMALTVLLLYAVGEPVMGHIVEPQVLGRKAGLSPFAMVASASLWTLIWGPVGLVLAAPLTMLLVVFGRYIPGLEVVSILFGDEPALDPPQELYGRLLAGDAPSAMALVTDLTDETSILTATDTMLLPAMRLAAADFRRGKLEPDRIETARDTLRDVIDVIDVIADATPDGSPDVEHRHRVRALIVPARGPVDALAAEIVVATLTVQGKVAAAQIAGFAGLTALSHAHDQADGAHYDAIVLTTVGGTDPRHLDIMARRAARDFPRARVLRLDCGTTPLPAGVAPEAASSSRHQSFEKLAAALDFVPAQLQAGPRPTQSLPTAPRDRSSVEPLPTLTR